MGDIVRFVPKKPSQRRRAIALLILAVVLVLLVVVYLNRYNSFVNLLFGRVFQNGIEEKQQIVTLNSGSKFSAGIFDDTLVIQGSDGYVGYSKSGQVQFTGNYYMANPVVKTAGSYVLTYDAGGRDCFLMDGQTVVRHITTDADIICAGLNAQGTFAIAVDDISSLGRVLVYDKGTSQLYDWFSGNHYIVDVALSPNSSRLAVCTLSVADTGLSSSIIQFNLSDSQPKSTITREDALFTRVKFEGNNSVIAMADDYVARYTETGEEIWNYAYDGGTLTTYSFDDSGLMAFAIKNPQTIESVNAIVVLNAGGKVVGTYKAATDASFISCKSNMVIATMGRELVVISKNGSELARTAVSRDITNAYVWDSRSFAVFTGNAAYLYQLH